MSKGVDERALRNKESEGKMLAPYTVGYHGSVYLCHWIGKHSTSETIGWFKDGWYKACIPIFFRKGLEK